MKCCLDFRASRCAIASHEPRSATPVQLIPKFDELLNLRKTKLNLQSASYGLASGAAGMEKFRLKSRAPGHFQSRMLQGNHSSDPPKNSSSRRDARLFLRCRLLVQPHLGGVLRGVLVHAVLN